MIAALNEKGPTKKSVQFTEEECFEIGRYTTVNGATNTVKRFKKNHPLLNFRESTAWKLRDWYKNITKQEKTTPNKMSRLKRGRPVMLVAALDENAKTFLLQLKAKRRFFEYCCSWYYLKSIKCKEQWWAPQIIWPRVNNMG